MIYFRIVGMAALLFFYVVSFFWVVGKMIENPNVFLVVGFILFTLIMNYIFFRISRLGKKQKATVSKQEYEQDKRGSY